MEQKSKSREYYTEEFKLSVLKDKYANNLSIYSVAKKYGIKASTCICAWEKSTQLTQNYYLCQMK